MPEQRKHFRIPVASRTFIELVSPFVDNTNESKLVACETQNVSQGGLQVTLEEKLTIGAILQIGIDLPDETDILYLAGEVRWCVKDSDDDQAPWFVGFKLLNANNSDIERWTTLLAKMED